MSKWSIAESDHLYTNKDILIMFEKYAVGNICHEHIVLV